LDAANASRELFEYDDALNYLDKADEVLGITKKINVESKELRILVECDRANVQNIGASVAAEKALEYIEKNSVSNEMLKFVAVRACYDAALQNNYDQEWFRQTREMAKKYLLTSQETLMKAEGCHFYAVSMKPQIDSERKMQRDYFNKAIELTKEEYLQTYAKIANSFAENLSWGDEEDKARAKELFMKSLQIKEHAEIKDLPGMARTYGGLGRLVFFNQPENTEEAKQYFLKDLELSKEIHDQLGISKMNSFLGACEFKLQNYKEALAYFDRSINLMHNAMDVYASYTSKLEMLVIMIDSEALKRAVDQYQMIVEKFGAPHPDTIEKITKIVESCPVNSECRKTLERLVDDHFSS
jgi:tetratricopeptide (TPR) repeat protein